MSPQQFLIIAVMTGGAIVGASMAATHRVQPVALQNASEITSIRPAVIANSIAISPSPAAQPGQQAPPVISPAAPAEIAASPLRLQLKQAIQERNLLLLKSLIRAGALQNSLRALNISEQETFENFEKLDASAWKILERAADYHCRHSHHASQTDASSACFE